MVFSSEMYPSKLVSNLGHFNLVYVYSLAIFYPVDMFSIYFVIFVFTNVSELLKSKNIDE